MMKVLYKWTDASGVSVPSYSDVHKWGEGVTHQIEWGAQKPILAYRNPSLAMVSRTLDYDSAVLWSAIGKIRKDNGYCVECARLTTVLPVKKGPRLSDLQIQYLGILCASATPKAKQKRNRAWMDWAESWLNGSDRSTKSVWEAFWHTITGKPVFHNSSAIELCTGMTSNMSPDSEPQLGFYLSAIGAAYYESGGSIDVAKLLEKAIKEA
jgi:hypothetical protein